MYLDVHACLPFLRWLVQWLVEVIVMILIDQCVEHGEGGTWRRECFSFKPPAGQCAFLGGVNSLLEHSGYRLRIRL